MSWAISGIGKAGSVRRSVRDQFANGTKSSEPEETVRQAAAALIDAALAGQGEAIAVKVSASGYQSVANYSDPATIYNNVSVTVEVQHGFIE